MGCVLLVCSFATMLFGGSYAGFDTARFWGSVVFFAAALPGLFEATKGMRWLNLAGFVLAWSLGALLNLVAQVSDHTHARHLMMETPGES